MYWLMVWVGFWYCYFGVIFHFFVVCGFVWLGLLGVLCACFFCLVGFHFLELFFLVF